MLFHLYTKVLIFAENTCVSQVRYLLTQREYRWVLCNCTRVMSFIFSYCSCGSHGKETGVIFHTLLQWTAFCQDSPLWLICLQAPARHGSLLHWVTQAFKLWQDCDPWRDVIALGKMKTKMNTCINCIFITSSTLVTSWVLKALFFSLFLKKKEAKKCKSDY